MFKPMLSATLNVKNLSNVNFPVLVSPKLDGVRCLIKNGVALSRSLKPIPNKHIQQTLGNDKYNGLDGELMLIENEDFNSIQSAIMSEEGKPNFIYYVFDIWQDDISLKRYHSFEWRLNKLAERVMKLPDYVQIVIHTPVNNFDELLKLETQFVKQGFEGIMIRSVDGPYKNGRSTVKEGYLLKLKRFKDAEAIIIGFTERLHNTNEAKKNELGHIERSHHKANMIPTDSLGTLIVKFNDKEFEVGTGFTEDQRNNLWVDRGNLLGKLIKFKYQDLSKYGVPRFPIFLGFRNERDLSYNPIGIKNMKAEYDFYLKYKDKI